MGRRKLMGSDQNKTTNSEDYENYEENKDIEENEDIKDSRSSIKFKASITKKGNIKNQIKNINIKENDQIPINTNASEELNISKKEHKFNTQFDNNIGSNENSTVKKQNSNSSMEKNTKDTTNLLLNIDPINKKAKILGSNYSLEIALEKTENLLYIKLNHDLYTWKNLSKSFSNDELDKCNSIWKNHSLEEKYTLMTAFFFDTKKENNKEELVDIASKYINIDQKSISVLFETGIKKNEITMKLEENKYSFKDLQIAEKLYFILESKGAKTQDNISHISEFICEYDKRIERLRNSSISQTVINLNI